MKMFRCICISAIFICTSYGMSAEALPEQTQVVEVTAESPPAGAIQPRAKGAEWLYVSYYFESGLSSSGGSSKEEVIEVREIDGISCYLVKLTLDWRSLLDRLAGVQLSEDDYSYFWEYYNEKGSYHYSVDASDLYAFDTIEDFSLTLPYPVEVGTTYFAEGSQYTVIADSVSIEVPAGAFNCVVYESIDPAVIDPELMSRERLFMAPGVGVVRWEMDSMNSGEWELEYRDDLFKYSLHAEEAEEAKEAKEMPGDTV